MGIFTYAFSVYLTAAVVLLASAIVNGVPLWPYPAEEVLIFLALAIVCTIFGHTVYNWSLRYLRAPVISTSLLGEPILASLLAFFLLGEAPGWTVIAAAPLVLAGVLLAASDASSGKEGRGHQW